MTPPLLLLPDDPAAPPRLLASDRDGHLVPAPGMPAPGGEAVVVVPATHVRIDWLDLPARHLPQAQAAARALLRERVAAAIEADHVAVDPVVAGPRACAVVSAERMRAWLDRLAQLGVRPVRLVPDALCLPDDGRWHVLADGDDRLLRGPGLAARLETDLADVVLAEAPERPIEASWADLLAGAPAALDLLQPPYATSTAPRARGWRLAAALAVLLATSPAWVTAAHAVRAHAHARALHWQAGQLASRVQPGAEGDQAVQALARQATRLRNAARLDAVLAEVAAATASVPGLQLDALDQRADGQLRLALSHADGGGLDPLPGRLQALGFEVAPGDTRRADRRVQVELLLTPTEATR